jgi:hypothetical protein
MVAAIHWKSHAHMGTNTWPIIGCEWSSTYSIPHCVVSCLYMSEWNLTSVLSTQKTETAAAGTETDSFQVGEFSFFIISFCTLKELKKKFADELRFVPLLYKSTPLYDLYIVPLMKNTKANLGMYLHCAMCNLYTIVEWPALSILISATSSIHAGDHALQMLS